MRRERSDHERKGGERGRIAPFSYVQLLVAISLGALVFGDHPDLMTGLGAAMIITAGLICWRAKMQSSVIADPE